MKRAVLSVCILALALILTACGPTPSDSAVSTGDSASGDHAFDYGGDVTLRILSGSENQELEGILDDFVRERGVNIEMDYQGSLDIMRALQGETIDYDAVWPASSLWLTAGDTQYRVKHAQSISITPVVFGIRQSLAEELGFVGREVSVGDLLSAIQAGGAGVLHDLRHPVQLRVQCLHRLPLRPAGQSGCDHVGEPPDPGPGGADHPAALRRGSILRKL